MDLLRRLRVRRRHPRRSIELPGMPPFEMAVHRRFDRYISYSIFELGRWEPFETSVVRRLLAPGGTFVDVGANIGWYTVVAGLLVGRGGRVFAFEPDADNFAILRHNVGRNFRGSARRALKIEPRAASDRAGNGHIFLSSDNMGDHRIYDSDGSVGSRKIREVPLDRYFRRFPRPLDVIKVDTQGAEPRVYAGAVERLDRDRPVLISEFWPHGIAASGRSPDEVLQAFDRLGARCLVIDDDLERLVPTTVDELARRCGEDLHPDSEEFVDLLVIPEGNKSYGKVSDLVAED